MFGFAWIIVSFVFGGFLGYLFFYFRYENRSIIDELRRELKEANKDRIDFQNELEEYKQQNEILKEELTKTLSKNNDLSKVVSELSRYYYKIKVGSEKIKDLSRELEIPDESILGQMKQYIEENDKVGEILNNNIGNDLGKTQKKDFF